MENLRESFCTLRKVAKRVKTKEEYKSFLNDIKHPSISESSRKVLASMAKKTLTEGVRLSESVNQYLTVYEEDREWVPQEGGGYSYGLRAVGSYPVTSVEEAREIVAEFAGVPVESEEVQSEDEYWLIPNEYGEMTICAMENDSNRGNRHSPAKTWDQGEFGYEAPLPKFDEKGKLIESYKVKFFQVFEAPKSPTENGKMIGQRGTLDDANSFGKEKVGEGNYIIKAVCTDGKTRNIDNDTDSSAYQMEEDYPGEGTYKAGPYWYYTKHGVGPGMLPKGYKVEKTVEDDDFGTYVALDQPLTAEEEKEYELIKKKPEMNESEYVPSVEYTLEKGDDITIWWRDSSWDKNAPCYASCTYTGRTRDGKYKFESNTYGHMFLVDATNNTVITPDGKEFQLDTRSGWTKIFNNGTVQESLKLDESLFDDENGGAEWGFVNRKQVLDSDGCWTDYTWYTDGERHIFIFGDSDLYGPENSSPDWECETGVEAQEWFDSYNGFEDDFAEDEMCPLGGDPSDDCAGCIYSTDYHFVNGECVRRDSDLEESEQAQLDESLKEALDWKKYRITYAYRNGTTEETVFDTWQSDVEYAWRMSNQNVPHTKIISIEPIESQDEELTEGKKGFLKKYNGCSIHDTGDVFVACNKNGLNIGQSKQLSGIEAIIDDYIKENPQMKEGLINEGQQLNEATGNFSYENRCVYVSDEDYEDGNVPATEERSISDNRNFPQYPLVDYNEGLKCHRIVLTPGYYEGACIDYVEIDCDELVDEYSYICENECDQIWYDEDTDMWVKNSYGSEPDENITIEQAVQFIQQCLKDYPMITAEDIKKALEEEKADGYYRISVFLQSAELLDKIEKYYVELEVPKCNEIIDQIKKDYGYRELVTTARFSNGETFYSFTEAWQDDLGQIYGYGKCLKEVRKAFADNDTDALNDIRARFGDGMYDVCLADVKKEFGESVDSTDDETLTEGACDYVSTYNGCTIYECDGKFICDCHGKSLSAKSEDELKSKIDSNDISYRNHYHNLDEDWTHFEFKSGSNPYIAKDEKEKNRILKKYGNKAKEIKPNYYMVDDSEDVRDLFSVDESADGDETLTEGYRDTERISALASYLDVDEDSIQPVTYASNIFEVGDAEWAVLTEDEAEQAAKNDIQNLYDDIGVDSFTPWFRDWIYDNAVDREWFEEALKESFENYVADIKDEDDRLQQEMDDAGVDTEEEFVDYLVRTAGDPIEYYVDNFGSDAFRDICSQNNLIDMDAVAEKAIEEDGVAHFVARYDGKEVDLGDGLFAYRLN